MTKIAESTRWGARAAEWAELTAPISAALEEARLAAEAIAGWGSTPAVDTVFVCFLSP